MKTKSFLLLLLAILMLCSCGNSNGNPVIPPSADTSPSNVQSTGSPQTSTETIPSSTLPTTPEFEPYINIFGEIGVNDDNSPILIPINDLLLNKIKEAIKPENEIEAELDTEIWKSNGTHTYGTYYWIGLDAILEPITDYSLEYRQWAVMINHKREGVLCDYWGKDGDEKAYKATDICNEIIDLANEALKNTKNYDTNRFAFVDEIKDIIKVESFEYEPVGSPPYDNNSFEIKKLKEYTGKKTIQQLEKLLLNSSEPLIGGLVKGCLIIKLTRADGEVFTLAFDTDAYMFSVNGWMPYFHKSGKNDAPMKELMKILDLDEWPN